MTDLVVHEYGRGPRFVIVLHGGPAAAGDVAPLARELGKRWHVIEPYQRCSSPHSTLSVATHVEDLHTLIEERCLGQRPILIGHSWGAMLALAYGATHPTRAAAFILIGCGTFSDDSRQEFRRRLDSKLTTDHRAELERLEQQESDIDRRFALIGRLMTHVYGHELIGLSSDVEPIDAIAHEQTWSDMMRLQREGQYPAAFAAILAPTLMLHGDVDPHPGQLIADELRRHMPHLEYTEFRSCGHSPWLERQARGSFFSLLNAWIQKSVQ
jgi:pimeloyl-ACP methyl ester carboxylesterase